MRPHIIFFIGLRVGGLVDDDRNAFRIASTFRLGGGLFPNKAAIVTPRARFRYMRQVALLS
ncbi:hypothetical protein F6R98_10670 [Candidatus Methylospira mobilis]|uniref:Uncharacterized protein n=1 Tax=Candidatus Methylospira mobilis TaxID=1808979 RepID=A0A5Q0BLD6_9GAMM|nr:hypothetical protein [Candidatus Methylospira mobilis]QFY43021.1 hypothetical protein F6R98_10670 [Candidatus Methylospira mobilis]